MFGNLGKDRVKPFTVLAAMSNAAAAQISLAYSLTGPSPTYSCACASSAVASGTNAVLIARAV